MKRPRKRSNFMKRVITDNNQLIRRVYEVSTERDNYVPAIRWIILLPSLLEFFRIYNQKVNIFSLSLVTPDKVICVIVYDISLAFALFLNELANRKNKPFDHPSEADIRNLAIQGVLPLFYKNNDVFLDLIDVIQKDKKNIIIINLTQEAIPVRNDTYYFKLSRDPQTGVGHYFELISVVNKTLTAIDELPLFLP
jgi:hypothetical protein